MAGFKLVFFGGLRFLSSLRLGVSGLLQTEQYFMLCDSIEQYHTSLRVDIQMKADIFFLVIAVFFDSNAMIF